MAKLYLTGIAIENFRAVGSKTCVGPFRDMNFFIGPNNAGKSTLLLFLAKYLHAKSDSRAQWLRDIEPIDVRLGKSAAEVKYWIGVSSENFKQKSLTEANGSLKVEIHKIGEKLTKECGLIWLHPEASGRRLTLDITNDDVAVLPAQTWNAIWRTLTNAHGGGIQDWTKGVLDRLSQNLAPTFPKVHLIPAIREVSNKGMDFSDYSGKGLIDKLAELQNPPHDERHLRARFDKINEFLRSVTDRADATIEIPHDRRYVSVSMDHKVLPLSSLGTGIHEVVMIASFCTLLEEQIVCVEEPEIHLHPVLQRKLIRYLRDNTSNQYFIATHSASIIDAVPASIFSVENNDGETSIRLCAAPQERHEICKTLGYRASDLLQSNSVIWVEGPSDRIYIKHWIRAIAPDLIEGVDYSIMFYGGRLLSHLSVHDPEVTDFISLRRLNRNLAIVIDSDREKAQSKINATKQRIVDELKEGFVWVTSGREIENYISVNLVQQVLSQEYPRFGRVVGTGRFEHRLSFVEKGSFKQFTKVDKVKVAQRVSSSAADLDELDLRKRVTSLVEFIRAASHSH